MSTIWSTMWFVHAYFLLLMFAPLINFIFENCSLKKCLTLLTPILVAVFGWGWLSTVPIIRRIIPVQNGLVAYSGITLIRVYIIARMVRISNIEKKIPMWITILLFVISLVFAPLGLARYNSPIAVIMAFTSFTIFNSLRIPDWFGKRLIFIAPSLFSVYLLHSNEAVGFRIIRVIIEWCNTGIAGCFVAAASVFVGCIILDIPRRVICSRIVMKCCKKA